MDQIPLIFAAGWFELIGTIAFVLFAIGRALLDLKKKPEPPPRIPKPRGAAQAGQKPRGLEDKLRTEVEQFLRQVQGEEPRPIQPKKPVVVVQKPVTIAPAQVTRHESFQERVTRNTSTADVTQHMATLGAEVGQADEKMEAHLLEKFQHQIGALEHRQKRPERQVKQNTAAAEFAQLLRSPNGMRQVIIASEILRRPEV
jgi:hypothetical protein